MRDENLLRTGSYFGAGSGKKVMPLRKSQAILVGFLALQTPAFAGDIEKLMPRHGETKCYFREYDAGHLAAHPNQLVTSMILQLTPSNPGQSAKYRFNIGVTVRGKGKMYVTGDMCYAPNGGKVECSITCDAGSFTLMPAGNARSLRLELRDLHFIDGCSDEFSGFQLDAGLDDRLFRLDPVQSNVCEEAGLQ